MTTPLTETDLEIRSIPTRKPTGFEELQKLRKLWVREADEFFGILRIVRKKQTEATKPDST